MAINYDDFGVCPLCSGVNLVHDEQCRHCNAPGPIKPMRSFDHSEGNVGCLIYLVLVGGGFLLGGLFGIGTGMGFVLGGGCFAVLGLFAATIPAFISTKVSESKIKKYKEEAIVLFENLGTQQINSAEEAFNLGVKEYSAANYLGAISFFQQAITEGIQNDDVDILLAACFMNTSKYILARSVYTKLWARTKTIPIAEALVRASLAAGISTISQVDLLMELNDKWVVNPQLKAENIIAIARYYAENNIESIQADEFLQQAIKLSPEDRLILKSLCSRLLKRGNFVSVNQYYSQFSLADLDPEAIEQYAQALDSLQEQTLQAIEIYRRALGLTPNNLNIINRLARTFMINKRFPEAIEVQINGLKLYPEDARLKYNLAICYMADNKFSEAIIELQYILRNPSALSFVPESVVRGQLGKCFLKQNLYDLALNQYLLADRSDDSLTSLYELGIYFEDNDDKENAVKCWKEIYGSDIAFKDVADRLRKS